MLIIKIFKELVLWAVAIALALGATIVFVAGWLLTTIIGIVSAIFVAIGIAYVGIKTGFKDPPQDPD